MPEKLKQFLQRWIISTVAVLVATKLVPGIEYRSALDLIIATLVLGFLNSFLRPVLMLLSLPLLIFTLGLFTIVINAFLLYLVSALMRPGFEVKSFSSAFWAALVISVVSLILNSLTRSGDTRISVQRGKKPEEKKEDDVIDV